MLTAETVLKSIFQSLGKSWMPDCRCSGPTVLLEETHVRFVCQVVLSKALSLAEVPNIPAAVGIPCWPSSVIVQPLLHWAAVCPVHPKEFLLLLLL